MPTLRLYLLGPPRIELDAEPIEIQRRKVLALMVYLAVTGDAQRRDTLATLLWPESSQSSARTALSRHLSELNKVLGEGWLSLDRETVSLNVSSNLWLDVAQFQQHLAKSEGNALESLTNAIDLYRDDFLTGFTLPDCPDFDEWQFFQAEGLRGDFATALERLIAILMNEGDYESAIPHARRRLALDPLHEPAHRQLMQLYTHSGQQAAALRQYQLCVKTLEDELGVPPSEETTTLYERIRIGALSREAEGPEKEKDSVVSPPPPLSPPQPPSPRHNLPPQPTPFIGRADELAQIRDRLEDPTCRLLTLIGPGGIGKTRLAIQVAQSFLDDPTDPPCFTHSITFVLLAPLTSPTALVATIADALDFNFYSDVAPKQQLLDYLREKSALLILDNFEHLLAGADVVSEILSIAPAVKALVTSREALNLGEEWFQPVSGMRFPQNETFHEAALDDYSAVQLFLQRAQRVSPGFSLSDEQAHVVRVCQLVEGMPLAIELAAAWLKVLPCVQISREIERNLDFLATRLRNIPARHRSMRAVFEHSWALLTSEEQDILSKLSVFRGSFQQEAAKQVAGASLLDLAALVEKSLLRTTPTGRYLIHELLRQFAAGKLAETADIETATRARHGVIYLQFLQEQEDALKSADQITALASIRAELDNIQQAWTWAIEQGEFAIAEATVEALYTFYQMRSQYQTGLATFGQVTNCWQDKATPETGQILISKSLARQGAFCSLLGDLEMALVLLQKALVFAQKNGLWREEAFALSYSGDVKRLQGDANEAGRILQESLVLYQQVDDKLGAVQASQQLGQVYEWLGHYSRALALYRESLALSRELGHKQQIAYCLDKLGTVTSYQGDLDASQAYYQESLTMFREIGDRYGIAMALGGIALTGRASSDQAIIKARKLMMEESLAICREIGHGWGITGRLAGMANFSDILGDYEAVHRYSQECLIRAKEAGITSHIVFGHIGQAQAALGKVDFEGAEENLVKALKLSMDAQLHPNVLWALAVWSASLERKARYLAVPQYQEAMLKEALTLLEFTMGHPSYRNITYAYRADPLLAQLETELPPQIVAEAKARSETFSLKGVIADILAGKEVGASSQAQVTPEPEDADSIESQHAPVRQNLPTQPTSFIGRETELAEIGDRLADPGCHLLTLAGPGGIGKTRLAIEAARLYGETTATRICYVSLAPFSDPERLLMAVVEALGIALYEQRDVKAQFLDYLSRRSMLLVLDNFEHLLAGAGLMAEIIQAAPAVKILITSRERLRLQGETIYLVRGMAIPNTATLEAGRDSSALQLFLQSARRIQANFNLNPTNIAALSRICQLVGGMPLGLELAAGWLDMLSPAEIAAEIERDLDFLASDLRDLPERQREMRTVFESAWQRLTEAERDAFQKLSLFRGGFTRQAAQQVASANLRTLTGLANKSFLQTVERPPSPIAGRLPTRYEVHELLRQFGAEKLSAAPQVQAAVLDRFSRYFADFLAEQEPRLKGGDAQLAAQIEIEEDIENIRLAWDLAIQHQQVEDIDKAMESLNYFYLNAKKWFQEGELAFSQAVAMLRGLEPEGRAGIVLGKTLARQGFFCTVLSRTDEAVRLSEESLTLLRRLGALHETAISIKAQGSEHMLLGNHAGEKETCLKAVEISRANEDLWFLSGGYFVSGYMQLGYIANTLGEFDEARQYHRQAINLCHKIGNRRTLGDVYNLLGEVHRSLGELAEAEALGLKSLEIRSAFGDQQGIAFCYYFLGDVAWRQGNFEKARRFCEQSLPIFDEINATWQVHFPLASLGSIACALADYRAAREYFARVLKDHQDRGIVQLSRLMEAVAGVADLLSKEGKVEKALELLTLVSEHEASWRETKDRADTLLAELEAELPPDVVLAAKEQGRTHDLAATVEGLLAELEKGM